MIDGFTLKPEMLKTETTIHSKRAMERELNDMEKAAVEEVPEGESVTQAE